MAAITAAGQYSVARVHNDLVYTAGMTPRINGQLAVTGVVGDTLTVADAVEAAAIAVRRALDAASSCLGPDQGLAGILSLTVYISATPSFTDLSAVADGASAVIATEFPDAELPVRAAVGVASLPGGAPVEVQLTATIR